MNLSSQFEMDYQPHVHHHGIFKAYSLPSSSQIKRVIALYIARMYGWGRWTLPCQFDWSYQPHVHHRLLYWVRHLFRHHLEYRYVITIYIVSGNGWGRWTFFDSLMGLSAVCSSSSSIFRPSSLPSSPKMKTVIALHIAWCYWEDEPFKSIWLTC